MTVSTTPAPTAAKTRLHGLDALRGGALLLGIVLHSLLPFLPGLPWVVVDQTPRAYAGAVNSTIHVFRMPLFMLLAGYFARVVVYKRGMGRYLRERALRIALPVFAFWPIAVVPLGLIAGVWASAHNIPFAKPPTREGASFLETFPTAHLWFLWTLFQLCLIFAALRWVAQRLAPGLTAKATDATARAATAWWAPIVLAIPFTTVLLWQGTGAIRDGLDATQVIVYHSGIQPPDGLLPTTVPLVAYGASFVCGWLLAHRPGSLETLATRWRFNLIAAGVLSVIMLWLSGLLPLPAPEANRTLAVVSALAAWAWGYGLIGVCIAHLRTERFWIRYLADASYWMYLLHLPLLAAIGGFFTHLAWLPELKILITLGLTTAILLLIYDAFVRSTWLGKWLNGHRWERAIFTRRATATSKESR